MSLSKSLIGYPKEFSIYIPLFSEKERELMKENQKNFNVLDGLKKVNTFLIELLQQLNEPSDMFFYALGKILFRIADYQELEILSKKYDNIPLK